MPKKYIVRLNEEERVELEKLISRGTGPARKLTHARILLKADADGANWTDEQIQVALDTSLATVERVREAFVEEGMEAARVLRVGGIVVIVPLYLASRYSILTDPLVLRANRVNFEPDAVVMAAKGWGNRHGRFYDPLHLSSRVLVSTKHLMFNLLHINNTKDVSESAYARFVLVGTKIDSQPNKAAAVNAL